MSLEQSVSQHYTHGNLEGALLEALQRAGKDLDRPDLRRSRGGRRVPYRRPAGDPRARRRRSTCRPARGCSMSAAGSAARRAASPRSAAGQVEGVDLTAEYVVVATALSRRVGVDRASFRQASATALPFADAKLRRRLHAACRHEHRRQEGGLRRGAPRAEGRRRASGSTTPCARATAPSPIPCRGRRSRRPTTSTRPDAYKAALWRQRDSASSRNAIAVTSRFSRCSGGSSRPASRSACRW